MTNPTLKQVKDMTHCPCCGAKQKGNLQGHLEYACGTCRGAKDSPYMVSQTIECKINELCQQRNALSNELDAARVRAEKAEGERDEMRRRWHKSRRACRQQGKGMQVQARINTLQSARALLHNKQKQELYEEVRRLKQEPAKSAFSTFHCHRCEITEDRLTQALKTLFHLYHEVEHAHRSGRQVPIDCVDMQIAKNILDSIKSPTPQDP